VACRVLIIPEDGRGEEILFSFRVANCEKIVGCVELVPKTIGTMR